MPHCNLLAQVAHSFLWLTSVIERSLQDTGPPRSVKCCLELQYWFFSSSFILFAYFSFCFWFLVFGLWGKSVVDLFLCFCCNRNIHCFSFMYGLYVSIQFLICLIGNMFSREDENVVLR